MIREKGLSVRDSATTPPDPSQRKPVTFNRIGVPLTLSLAGIAIITAAGIVAQGIFISIVFTSGDIPHKSDEEMISTFNAHEAEFNQLVDMVMEDKKLHRVDDDWTDPRDPQTIGVDEERIARYRRLFQALDIPRGFCANQDAGILEFISSTQGLAVSGSSKGYVWLKKAPSNVVDSIDRYTSRAGASYPVCRRIRGNWYLIFDAD